MQGRSAAELLPAPARARHAPTAIQRDPAPAVLTPPQQRDDAMREFKASYDALPPGPDRAKALRRYLMISRKQPPFHTQDEVDWLIKDSLDGAESELETWQSLTDDGEFETASDSVDKQIVAAAKYARMWRAIVWSYERSYMTGEAVNVFRAIYEHPIRTIGTIVGIIGLGPSRASTSPSTSS